MKKFTSFFIVLTLLVSMLSAFTVSAAVNTTVFYNAADDSEIVSLDNVDSLYATTTFTGRYENNASVIAAHYDADGKLTKTEFINPVESTIGESVEYTTPHISVTDTDILKIFAWTGVDTIKPLLKFPGVISRSVPLPTATVTELDVATITTVPLTFAMNFKADPSTKAQLLAYGNWYADFELKINKDVTFNLDGTKDGYLAGQYDSWSPFWVTVPKKDVTLAANTPLKIMETGAETYGEPGLKYTYQEVYDRVKDFDCGVFFTEDFLAANPDLYVTLELKIYNPLDESHSYVIGETYEFGSSVVAAEKFETVFQNTDTYLYRVGNQNSVALSKLFAIKDGAEIGTVSVTAATVDETGVVATISEESNWASRTVSFTGTGLVKLTIADDDELCKPTQLYLEVVDAYNVTAASNATDRDIVLLNNVGLGQQVVSGGHTIYGNGFSMTATTDQAALDRGYAFLTLENGHLDNVRIVAPHFSYPILYESNKADDPTEPQIDGTKTRYYNIRSAVMTSGDCTIKNSYISGGRAALYVTAGDLMLDNTTIYGGAAANIHLNAANSLTMRDVTMVQEPIQATVHDTTKTLMGLSLITIADTEGYTTPITLEGKLIQYAWANEEYKVYVPAQGQSMVNYVLEQTDYIHPVTYKDGITRDSLNLGFIYMVDDGTNPTLQDPVVYDYRTNQDTVPYETLDMTSVKVYSYKNTNGTDPEVTTCPTYQSEAYGNTLANAIYADADDSKVMTKEYIHEIGWINRLTVNLDNGFYDFDFSKLKFQKYGKDLSYSVSLNGETVDVSAAVPVSVGTVMYDVTVTDHIFYDQNGQPIEREETYTYPFYLSGTETTKAAPVLHATNWEAGLCVASSKGGTWHGAAPALEGVQITYWSVAEGQYKTISLSDYTPTTVGPQNGTNTTWTYSPENGDFTLTVTGGQVHSSKKVYAMPVVVDCNGTNKLYFVASSSTGLVNTGNTARSVPVSYVFTDKNQGSLSFSHTWSVAEDQDNEYSYTKFCEGTLEAAGSGGCFTADTLITMADGSQKAIKDLTTEDTILSYNFFTGAVEETAVALLVYHGEDTYPVANLTFSDGTELKIIADHGLFDYDANQYVYLSVDNMADYLGHTFVKMGVDGTYELVTLDAAYQTNETTGSYSLTSAYHANAFAEGMLTVAPPDDFYNWMEMGDKLRYDTEAFQKDVETYGLYTYADFQDYVTYRQFVELNGAYLKIPAEKGIFNFQSILNLIELYIK